MLFDSNLKWFFENANTDYNDDTDNEEKETVFDVAKKLLDFFQSGGWNPELLDLQNFAQEHKEIIWGFFIGNISSYKDDFFNWEMLTPEEIARRYVFELVGNYEGELLTVAKVGELLKCNS